MVRWQVDENMAVARLNNAIATQKFHFRSHVVPLAGMFRTHTRTHAYTYTYTYTYADTHTTTTLSARCLLSWRVPAQATSLFGDLGSFVVDLCTWHCQNDVALHQRIRRRILTASS